MRRAFPSTFSLSYCLRFSQRECTAGIKYNFFNIWERDEAQYIKLEAQPTQIKPNLSTQFSGKISKREALVPLSPAKTLIHISGRSEVQNVKLEAQFSTNQAHFMVTIFRGKFEMRGRSQNLRAPYLG